MTPPVNLRLSVRTSAHLLAGALLAALAFPAAAAGAETAAPVTIIVVRHGEKSSPSGNVPLSTEGHARAAALAEVLKPAGITAVFSSELTFAQETAAPIARQRGLTPAIFPVQEPDRLIAALEKLPPGSVALVINHSNRIPVIVEKLSGLKPGPVEEFDRMFVLTRIPGAPPAGIELRYATSLHLPAAARH
jgi:phosphohistidine phosphatase SixA